jgi:hypothetical protein
VVVTRAAAAALIRRWGSDNGDNDGLDSARWVSAIAATTLAAASTPWSTVTAAAGAGAGAGAAAAAAAASITMPSTNNIAEVLARFFLAAQ